MIQGSILAFTKWHVVRRLHDAGAILLRTLEVTVEVIDCYVDVGRDFFPVRCAKGSALTTEHDCTLGDGQLRMANHPVAFSAEALRKAERPTEPVDRLTDVLVDQDRHYSHSWGRSVLHNSCFHLSLPDLGGPTVELTRRRESKHPSPHQASCETRSRRSRPTICYVAARSNGSLVGSDFSFFEDPTLRP